MFVKILVLFLFVAVCLAIPVEDKKYPPFPGNSRVPPASFNDPHTLKSDTSDLKTDPSTWLHTYYHTYPVYYYNVHEVPTYTYWHHYY